MPRNRIALNWFLSITIVGNYMAQGLEPSWREQLQAELGKPYLLDLKRFLSEEKGNMYPPSNLIFNAFWQTPFDKVKVVIVGQDPYHGEGQAEGLCFSVREGISHPPSLKNIFKELQADLGISPPSSGSLLSWASQGVLLLNAILTVRPSSPLSHRGKGWEVFTDAVIDCLLQRKDPLIFVLWGKSAQEKVAGKQLGHHVVLTAPHPSPFSAHTGFFGCRHFSKINALLKSFGKEEIQWG